MIPKHLVKTVELLENYQREFFVAANGADRLAAARRVKAQLYEVYREVDREGLNRNRTERAPFKQMLEKIDENMGSFKRVILILTENPNAETFHFVSVDCGELRMDLNDLWYRP